MNASMIKVAASTLAVSASLVGFSPLAQNAISNEANAEQASISHEAVQAAADARGALASGNGASAVAAAERAVEFAPRSAEYRHLLGQAYMAAGRLSAAETSFQDALTINPDLDRTAFNLALVQIAQGRKLDARDELRALEGSIGASDLGLAMALAGDHERAIAVLDNAARADGTNRKARQNLALAYALAGRWGEARVTAAQDISMADLDQRMREWASFAQPTNSWDQVAGMLGLNVNPADPGQPVRLALGPAPAGTMTASVEDRSGETDPVVAFAAPVEEEPAAPAPDYMDEPAYAVAEETPAAVAVHREDAPQSVSAPSRRTAPAAPAVRTASATPAATPAPREGDGRFMVQIGAFAQPSNVQIAWDRAVSKYGALDNYTPNRAEFDHGRMLYRLAFGGFDDRAAAAGLCQSLRTSGIDCFVRARAGDTPLQMAVQMAEAAHNVAERDSQAEVAQNAETVTPMQLASDVLTYVAGLA